MRRLFELRPWYKLVPDQTVIVAEQAEVEERIQAANAKDGSFLIAYLPRGGAVNIHMEKISGKNVKARWFDPREGTWREIGQYPNAGAKEFSAPSAGEKDDWVLVLEDAAKNFPLDLTK